MKQTLKEAIIIIVLASILGLVYNYFSSKPLPWLYTPKKVEVVNDSVFNLLNPVTADSQSKANDRIVAKIDTLSVKEKKTEIKDTAQKKPDKPETNVIGSKLGAIKTVTLDQVKKHVKDINFIFVDARPEEEYKTEHIGNAISIFPYDENKDNYFKKLTTLPNDKIIVVYCSGGQCEASHHIVEDLISFGYTKVFLFAGGWEEWTKNRKK
jgi:rhodanese-related sulfurtransferase